MTFQKLFRWTEVQRQSEVWSRFLTLKEFKSFADHMVLTHSNVSVSCLFKLCGHSSAVASYTSWKFSYEIRENWKTDNLEKKVQGGQKDNENSMYTLKKVLGTCLVYLQLIDPGLFTWKSCSWHYHLITHPFHLDLKCWMYTIPDHLRVKRISVWKKGIIHSCLKACYLLIFAEAASLEQCFFTETEETLFSTFLYPEEMGKDVAFSTYLH